MLPGFGWSAGNVATACVVIFHIIKAFDDVKGAKKQYRESHAFLCGLYLIIEYISDPNKSASLPREALIQIKSISDAYEDLRTYIVKHSQVGEDKTRLRNTLPKIRWSLHDLNHKFQTMKTNSLDAIAIMETLVVMDLSSRVNALIQMSDRQEQSLEAASQVLIDARHQVSSLSRASEDYRKLLDDWNQSDDDATMDPQYIEDRLNAISKSQSDLQDKLDELTQHLEERSRDVDVRAEHWSKLLEEHKEASMDEHLANKTRAGLKDTNDLIGGVGQVTKNSHLQQTASQVDGVSCVLGALGPLGGKLSFSSGGFWGSKKSERSEPQAPVRQDARESAQSRVHKPPPTVTTPPPPVRNHVASLPPQPSPPGSWSQSKPNLLASAPVSKERINNPVPAVTTPPPILRSTYSPRPVQTRAEIEERPALPPRPKSSTSSPQASDPAVRQEVVSCLTSKTQPPAPWQRQLGANVVTQCSSPAPKSNLVRRPPPPLPPRKFSTTSIDTNGLNVPSTKINVPSYELQSLAGIGTASSSQIPLNNTNGQSTRSSSFTGPSSSSPSAASLSTPPTSSESSPSNTPAQVKSTLVPPQQKSPSLLELSKRLQANQRTRENV